MVKVATHGLMDDSISVDGKMADSMEKVHIFFQTQHEKEAFGKMENALTGSMKQLDNLTHIHKRKFYTPRHFLIILK